MKVKVGVIGAGVMGSLHARIYNQLEECELVGICDIDPSKIQVAEKYQCKFFSDSDELLKEDMDAVSICTQTSSHKVIALEALEMDKHVLVEKPFTIDVESGEEIVKKARETGRLTVVGYVERFNPAVTKLKELVDFSEIYSTISTRVGPGTPRVKDIGVLLDLGSHEIDVLNYLTGTCPKILYSHISHISNKNDNNNEDYAYLSLKYAQTHSHIETSWVPNYKSRFLSIYGNDRFYILNYARQILQSFRSPPKVKVESESWNDFLWISRNIEEDISIMIAEPAKLELRCFINSIRKGECLEPLCTANEALEVLKIIEKAFTFQSNYSL